MTNEKGASPGAPENVQQSQSTTGVPSVSTYLGIAPEPVKTASVDALVAAIRSDRLKPDITRLREVFERGGKEASNPLKLKLPGCTWQGTFSRRAADGLLRASGLVVLDFDELTERQRTSARAALESDPHTVLAFTSPSGNGVKVVLRVGIPESADPKTITRAWGVAAAYARGLTGIEADPSGRDCSRLCFLSYDPTAFYRADPVPLLVPPEEPRPAATLPATTREAGAPGAVRPYCTAALEAASREVAQAPEGARNHTLNAAAFGIGQLVGAGGLVLEAVLEALTAAGVAAGLPQDEAEKAARSGLTAGAREPRDLSGVGTDPSDAWLKMTPVSFQGTPEPDGADGADGTPAPDEGSSVPSGENPAGTDGTLSVPLAERPAFRVVEEWTAEQETGHKLKPGVWWFGVRTDRKTGEQSPIKRWVCSPLHLVAVTFDSQGNNFGRLLRFQNTVRKWREWPMPMATLRGSGEELRGELLSMGVHLAPDGNRLLAEYLQERTPKTRIQCALQVGWCGDSFILPDRAFGPRAGSVVFQSGDHGNDEHTVNGTLEGWQQEISRYAVGNSYLLLNLSAAFAGPLLGRCSAEGGGLHFSGDSSLGKSTAVEAACSIWGGANYKRSWRATANGMEGAAALFTDCLLALDEIGECDPREVGAIVYALGNGRGKQRASRTGSARGVARWRCLILSTGERTVGTIMASSPVVPFPVFRRWSRSMPPAVR